MSYDQQDITVAAELGGLKTNVKELQKNEDKIFRKLDDIKDLVIKMGADFKEDLESLRRSWDKRWQDHMHSSKSLKDRQDTQEKVLYELRSELRGHITEHHKGFGNDFLGYFFLQKKLVRIVVILVFLGMYSFTIKEVRDSFLNLIGSLL